MSLITVIKRTAYIGKFSAHHALIRVKNAHARRAPREQIFCNLKKKSIFPWKCSLSSKYFLFQMWSSSKYSLVPMILCIIIPWSKWSIDHINIRIIIILFSNMIKLISDHWSKYSLVPFITSDGFDHGIVTNTW